MSDVGADTNTWVNVIRRARLGATTKLVALMIATYADPDGTHVFPGAARLAVQCEVSYSAARRALARLRGAGLIELARRGARKRGQADEYRLILAVDLMERCEVPAPDQERLAVERLNRRERRGSTVPGVAVEATSTAQPVTVDQASTVTGEAVEPAGGQVSTVHQEGGRTVSTAQVRPVLPLTTDRPPSIRPLPDKQPPSQTAGVPADVAVARARDREQDPIPTKTKRNTDVPTCERCGTMLDPDGSCFICRTPGRTAA